MTNRQEVLDRLVAALTADGAVLAGRRGAGRSWVVARLAERVPGAVVVRAAPGRGIPGWTARELVRAADRPLIVDDAHLLDAAATDVLARRGAPAVCTVVEGRGTGLTLDPLDLAATAELAAEILTLPMGREAARALHEATGGLPGVVQAVLAAAQRAGAVRVIGDVAVFDPGHVLALPPEHPLVLGAADAEHDQPPAVLAGLAAAVPAWLRADMQHAELGAGTDTLTGCALRAGHALSELPLDGRLTDRLAAQLHGFARPGHPIAEERALTAKAARHWASVGDWTAIAKLPARQIGAPTVPLRTRATLLTAGLDAALSDVERLPAVEPEGSRWLRSELLTLAGSGGDPADDMAADRSADHGDQPAWPGGHFLAEGRPALAAWLGGRWDDALAIATRDRLTNRGAHALCTAEESAAIAAEVLLSMGKPTVARSWLEDVAVPPDQPGMRVLSTWAAAGLDALLGRPQEGAHRLSATLAWMRETGWRRHRELVLGRLVTCMRRAGMTVRAKAMLDELTADAERDPSGFTRLIALRSAIEVGAAGPADLDAALALAEELQLPFELARTRLAVGRVTGDEDVVAAAQAGFAQLGATLWELRAGGAPDRDRVAELIGDLIAAGLSNASIATVVERTEAFVKRRVSWLLADTGSRHRTQLGVRRAELTSVAAPAPATVDEVLAGGVPVVALLGAPGSGRSTVLRGLAERGGLLVHAGRTPLAAGLVSALAASKSADIPALVLGRAAAVAHSRSASARPAPIAVADALLDALSHAARRAPLTLLVDDADLADEDGTALLTLLADRAGGGWSLVLAGVRSTVEQARPVRLQPLTTEQVADALDQRFGRRYAEETVAEVHRRTAGHPATVAALLRSVWEGTDEELRTVVPPPLTEEQVGVVLSRRFGRRFAEETVAEVHRRTAGDPSTVARLLRVVRAADDERLRTTLPADGPGWLAVIAAVPGIRMAECRALAVPLGLSEADLPAVAAAVSTTADGGLFIDIPLRAEAAAAGMDAAVDAAAMHRLLADRLLADRLDGIAIEDRRLAGYLLGARVDGKLHAGQAELAEIAELVLPGDPEAAADWSAAVLESTEDVRARTTHAEASYAMSRYAEAATSARRALTLLPADDEAPRRAMRTVLINSMIRLGQHDRAFDLTAGPSVPEGLQHSRILLLQQRFDDALETLSSLAPRTEKEQGALSAGVRLLAAIGAGDTSTMPTERLVAARQALAWGDLYTAELSILPRSNAAPAARRTPPPSFTRLSAAIEALMAGNHTQVVVLADENAKADNEAGYIDEVLAALAAEALVQRGELAQARARLQDATGERVFGYLVAWAAAGMELAEGRNDEAVARLTEADRTCARLGYLPGRELVLGRLSHALSAAGDRAGAEATDRTLARLATVIGTPQAMLSSSLSHAALTADEQAAQRAVRLAEEVGNGYYVAHGQVLLAVLRANKERGTAMSYQDFYQHNVRRRRVAARQPREDALTARDRELIDLIAAGATNTEAAAALHVTEKAIEARLTRMYRRTGLRSRVELVREYGA
ncbi:LuxR C-terminal-related transcriptional regulator [Labedaea rhizosphaerae]|uniref:Regulatory LuxR family protein n=1 Tax=Labedaea rhizosphaerae TaxID=598644 RepID=A0A4R6SBR5_LABRH|nr:LuxR C-terminal-related transcriptional regulator [Labedaea rhizosphaerae]TDP97489.1 regulatory LuxR family protein [Labedaea rhizosphaerae]